MFTSAPFLESLAVCQTILGQDVTPTHTHTETLREREKDQKSSELLLICSPLISPWSVSPFALVVTDGVMVWAEDEWLDFSICQSDCRPPVHVTLLTSVFH